MAEQQPPPKGDRETRENEAWRWADAQLTSCGKPQKDDYDFFKACKWTKSASNDLLNAGCLYEYARESHKYRCFLVLRHTPKRERFWLPRLIGLEFEGSSAGHNHLFMSGWGTWLDNFAGDLIANKSFEKVFRTDSSKVLKKLDAVDTYCLYPNAVELPGRFINYPGSQDVLVQICWRHY